MFNTAAAIAGEDKPVVLVQASPEEYTIKAEMTVPYPSDMVYRTITDYDSIDEHISLFETSRILLRKKNVVHVHQVHILKILFWDYKTESYVVIEEIPGRGFNFKGIKGSYSVHKGSWRLTEKDNGQSTLIKYEVQAIPILYVPRWLVSYFMEQEVNKAFVELYQWIENELKPTVGSH